MNAGSGECRGRPYFILFEGIDGSGKSTQARLFAEYCSAMGLDVRLLSEPSDGIWGKEIRAILSGQIVPEPSVINDLFIRDREDDVQANILPALKSGASVVMDRYYYSNIAYQGAMGMSPEAILLANRERNFPEPDRVYFLDIDPKMALERVKKRQMDSEPEVFEREKFLKKVNSLYRRYANDHFVIIEAGGEETSVFDLIRRDFEFHVIYREHEK